MEIFSRIKNGMMMKPQERDFLISNQALDGADVLALSFIFVMLVVLGS